MCWARARAIIDLVTAHCARQSCVLALQNIKGRYVTISGIVELPDDGLSTRFASNIVSSPERKKAV